MVLSLALMSVSSEDSSVGASRVARSLPIAILSGMRPLQAPKNGLVLVPLIFSVNVWFAVDDFSGMFEIVLRAVGAAVAFTLLSGAVYLINDLVDIERDRAHPVKRRRAIASGDLPVGTAYFAAFAAAILAWIISALISAPLAVVSAGYLILNLAYTFKLKHVAILDVISVAAGFVLRAYAGYVAIGGPVPWFENGSSGIDIDVSPWFYLMTALGALLLALGKRRAELKNAGDDAGETTRHSGRIHDRIHRRADHEHGNIGDLDVFALRCRPWRYWCQRARRQHHDVHHPLRCLWHLPLPLSDLRQR